jgi:subtilisin family serine protease
MSKKLLVSARTDREMKAVRATRAKILAEYPDGVLVRATERQAAALEAAGIEAAELPSGPIQTAGARFALAAARAADEQEPIAPDRGRTAYFILALVGPLKQEWLEALAARGASVHGTLPGFHLLAGMLPAVADAVADEPFVEGVSLYRPAMKVSPELRPDVSGRELDAAALRSIAPATATAPPLQIEVSVFPGESTEDVAARVRASGGVVLASDPRTVTAQVPAAEIADLAEHPGVLAILPHAFPTTTNDRATAIMNVPSDHVFHGLSLTGAGQIVGIVDTGLDTGDPATVHPDLAGRVVDIVSSPNQFTAASLDMPPFDDGPEDEHGHGTHVAGSVAGNGSAAIAAGSASVPRGIAPEARVHFTSVGQRVTWNPLLFTTPPGPPSAWGLHGLPNDPRPLFDVAYQAGARVHSNSWGMSNTTTNLGIEGSYNAVAHDVDEFMFTHRDALLVFSAGNNGRDVDSDAQIDADSIGPPGTAKNVLTVGATENDRPHGSTPTPGDDRSWVAWGFGAFSAAGHMSDSPGGMALFSSRGPCDFGRLKPEVCAPGTNILSTRSSVHDPVYVGKPAGAAPGSGDVTPSGDPLNGRYNWNLGTSMATPLVAGAAALVRQHLVTQRGHVQDGVAPSGALLKAFLVNGATPIAGQYTGEVPAGRNNVSGFGRVDVAASLAPGVLGMTLFSDDPTLAVGGLFTGSRHFTVRAVDLSQPMKITLCWTDAPGAIGIGYLENHLYLVVRSPFGGPIFDGDVNPYPNPTNPTQQVIVANPVTGDYEVEVRSLSIAQRSAGAGAPPGIVQDFALVASNAMGLSVKPVSIATAIDTTGSMDAFGFMEPAKERAGQLLDFLRAGDRHSVSEFSQRAAPPDGRTPFPMRTLTAVTPDWTDARGAIGALHAQGNTPIGAGLSAAWSELILESSSRPRAIVLLSDGFNNTPPDPATVLSGIPRDIPIFTIALGPAALTSALQSIATSRPGGGYFAVESDQDVFHLHEIYAALQGLATGAVLLSLSSPEVNPGSDSTTAVPVEPGLNEMAVCASWDGPRDDVTVELVDPDGKVRDASSAGTQVLVMPTHRVIRIAAPAAGAWTVLLRARSRPARVAVSATAPSDLRLSGSLRTVGAKSVMVEAILTGDAKLVGKAKVRARVTTPRLSVAAAQKRFADKIAKVKLPKALREPRMTKAQLGLVSFAAFALGSRLKEGGLLGRTSTEVGLKPLGDGRFGATIPLPAVGTIDATIVARGKGWQRVARVTSLVGVK